MENKNQAGNLMNVLSFIAEQTMALSKQNTVLGEPIEKDGVTVIPVSKLSVGFAGGGADLMDAGRKKNRHPAGGGAKVTLTPMSFLVIQGADVRLINLELPERTVAAEIFDAVMEQLKKKKKEK
jgi:uncharacterized spore protein YtfJ